jgi:curli biogenesis system outer membrane secretion channel CsgG
MEELEFQLVESGKFKIVDRKSLEVIRSERNFQMSGEVSDESAVSIGNLLGAHIVITGALSGSGETRRLNLKALDVQTAEILVNAREPF